MGNAARNSMHFFWWLRHILFLWVRTKVVPANTKDEIGLASDAPVCYVLHTKSVTDLLVLEAACRTKNMPLPHLVPTSLKGPEDAAFVCLQRVGFLQVERSDKELPSPLLLLSKQVESNPESEIQIVPVSVFWGRNPGRDEKSIMRLLFFDDEHAGWLQKFFIVLVQGRINFVQFGKPISLRSLVNEGLGPDQTAKKLRRVLRVHFRRQRTATMGPSLPSRANVVASLMQTKAVKAAVLEEARKKRLSLERAETRARRYIAEIASEQKYSVIRLADMMFAWLWNKIFDGVLVKHAHRLRQIDQTHEIVYLPAHRSHLDYLLLAYTLYAEGMTPPHTAAGVNLNFWPVGPFLRRGGAFYLRRSFGGNRLYGTVFNEYVHYLLTKGHPVKFYIEGGRSRTGRLLPAKTGMLAMVVQSFLRNSNKPIVFVPVYVGYDKVAEVGTYQNELRGAKKKTESVGQLVKARRVLKTHFGKVYLGFGEPLYLKDFLDTRNPQWRESIPDPEEKPSWLHPIVVDLADEVLTRINSTAVVSPIGLVCLILLSVPTHAIPEEDLLLLLDKLLTLMRVTPYSADVVLPEGEAREILRRAMSVAKVERFQHPGGDVIHVDEVESVLLGYYRNNVLHLVAVPSLVAAFYQHNERLKEGDLRRAVRHMYPFLAKEFFLRFQGAESDAYIDQVIESFVSEKLLFRETDPEGVFLRRPDVTSRDLATLHILARAVGKILERFAISSVLLAKQGGSGPVDNREIDRQCQLMAQRTALLSGSMDGSLNDHSLHQAYFNRLEELGYVKKNENMELLLNPGMLDVAESSMMLISDDIRQSIWRMATGPRTKIDISSASDV